MGSHYGDAEIKIFEAGADAVKAVFDGEDIEAKKRLLFYLDRVMDPFYGQDISGMTGSLKDILQNLIITSDNDDITGEAVHLLSSYTSGPYEILKADYTRVPEPFKADVLYLFNDERGSEQGLSL
ncbi:MAG: hypothetical protein IJK83_01005 [Clostridiales bacterium]|nr:hypothetical protein [Clostridiales bacterium]